MYESSGSMSSRGTQSRSTARGSDAPARPAKSTTTPNDTAGCKSMRAKLRIAAAKTPVATVSSPSLDLTDAAAPDPIAALSPSAPAPSDAAPFFGRCSPSSGAGAVFLRTVMHGTVPALRRCMAGRSIRGVQCVADLAQRMRREGHLEEPPEEEDGRRVRQK